MQRCRSKQEETSDVLYKYVVSNDGIINWQHLEYIWKTILEPKKPQSVILCSPFLDSNAYIEKALDLLINKFQVAEVLLCSASLLAMYSRGKTTGAMIECGDLYTKCYTIYDGFSLYSPYNSKINIGGRKILNYFSLMLKKRGYCFNTFKENWLVREMMEKQCFLRKSASTIVDNNAVESTYLLPDQSKVVLRNERWQPPELIFDPKLMDVSLDGVHTNLVKCISNCDLELRRALFATVNIFGGVSKIPGFKERFINELQPICPHDAKIKLFSLKEPNNAMFSGGSVVAQLASLKGLFITKKDLLEGISRSDAFRVLQ